MVMEKPVLLLIVGAIAAGAAIGAFKAKTVEMTSMPEAGGRHALAGGPVGGADCRGGYLP